MFGAFKKIITEKEHSFTLIELIVVIIIVGILAAVGISQYSTTVEKSRLAEAKIRIGTMRDLAHQYWLENGDMTNIQDADLGVDGVCYPTDWHSYAIRSKTSTYVDLAAWRCTSGGKTPNASGVYDYYMRYYPSTGQSAWYCYYTDGSSCFGLPTGP